MAHRLVRVLRGVAKSVLLEQQYKPLNCIFRNASRTYVSEMRKSAFEGKMPYTKRDAERKLLKQKKMRRILGGRGIFPYRLTFYRIRTFCSDKPTIKNNSSSENGGSSSLSKYDEQYKALSNLDFMSAARILFSDPPKKKKFGLDFHVVQFFIACLPSLAVYLVAQYARSEMRKMDAELELKKQAEFEAQAKEMELKAAKEKAEAAANPEFLEVKERLNKLEETVKQIAEVTNKKSGDINELIQATQAAEPEGDKIEHRSEVDKTSKDRTNENKSGTAAVIHASRGNQKCNKNGGASEESKK